VTVFASLNGPPFIPVCGRHFFLRDDVEEWRQAATGGQLLTKIAGNTRRPRYRKRGKYANGRASLWFITEISCAVPTGPDTRWPLISLPHHTITPNHAIQCAPHCPAPQKGEMWGTESGVREVNKSANDQNITCDCHERFCGWPRRWGLKVKRVRKTSSYIGSVTGEKWK
jgi:hypothetical protein